MSPGWWRRPKQPDGESGPDVDETKADPGPAHASAKREILPPSEGDYDGDVRYLDAADRGSPSGPSTSTKACWSLMALGLHGAVASSRTTEDVWLSSGRSSGLALRIDHERRSVTFSPRTSEANALACVGISGLGVLFVPLRSDGNARAGQARLHDLGEALAGEGHLQIELWWMSHTAQLAHAAPHDLQLSVRAAAEFGGAVQLWRTVGETLDSGPARTAIEQALND